MSLFEVDDFAEDLDELEVLGQDAELDEGPSCRGCGCTSARACPGGCVWATDDLCSACVRAGLS